MLATEIIALRQLADMCTATRGGLTYRDRVAIERTLLISASLVAYKCCGFRLMSFSMTAFNAFERAVASCESDRRAVAAVLLAFELAAVLGKICSVNPYVAKEIRSDSHGSMKRVLEAYGRRLLSYADALTPFL